MARYEITDQSSGQTLVVEGEGAPTEQDAAELFQTHKATTRRAALDDSLPTLREGMASVGGMGGWLGGVLAEPLLTQGGHAGDIASRVLPPIAGQVVGTTVAPFVGTAVGGGLGGLAGETLGQAREYLRGERDNYSPGQMVTATAASAIPLGGPLLASPLKTIASRAVQSAGIIGAADVTGQMIDTGEVNPKQLGLSVLLGSIFGAGAGGLESLAVRKAALRGLRGTPEFANFKGSDEDLKQAAFKEWQRRTPRTESGTPVEPINVTPAGETPGVGATSVATPPLSAEAEMLARMKAAGLDQPIISAPNPAPAAAVATVETPGAPDISSPEIPSSAAVSPSPEPPPADGASSAPNPGSGAEVGAAPVPPPEKPGDASPAAQTEELPAAGEAGSPTTPAGSPGAEIVEPLNPKSKLAITLPTQEAAQAWIARKPGIKEARIIPAEDGFQVHVVMKGARRTLGSRADGEPDLIDHLTDLQGVPPMPPGVTGGEWNGYKELFQQGPGRVLINAAKKGIGMDQYIQQLAGTEYDHLAHDVQAFYAAAGDAFAKRVEAKTRVQAQQQQATFMTAALTRKVKPVPIDTLARDDAWKIKGAPVRVVGIHPETGDVIVQDGPRFGQQVLPAGQMLTPDRGSFQKAAPAAGEAPAGTETENVNPFEDATPYAAAHARYKALRSQEKLGTLKPEGHAELDRVEAGLGQDFIDFYQADKAGALTTAAEQKAQDQATLKARSEQRLQAGNLESQIDLFGPSSDKSGQGLLFDGAVNRYLDARGVREPGKRVALRGLLSGIWERKLENQLELDFAGDARLAAALPATSGNANSSAPLGRVGGNLPGELGPTPGTGGLAGSTRHIRLDALRFTNQFLRDGYVQLVGRKFTSNDEMVAAAQLLRNREVETLWILPLKADGTLLMPHALQSRIPNMVDVGSVWDYATEVSDHLGAQGAHSYWMMHNHPSADARASKADIRSTIAFTQKIAGARFRGHLVINHGTYSLIQQWGQVSYHELPAILAQPDPTAIAQGSSPFLGRPLIDSLAVRSLAYELQAPDHTVTLFLRGAKEGVNGVATLQARDFEQIDTGTLQTQLQDVARRAGAVFGFAYYQGKSDVVQQRLQHLVRQGYFTDAVVRDAQGIYQTIGPGPENHWFGSDRAHARGERFAEDAIEYDPESPVLYQEADGTVTGVKLAHLDKIPVVEMPELIQLVKQWSGSIPRLKKLRVYRGYFQAGKITLDRRLFADPVQAAKTLAHELGHLVDYLPDRSLARGNLLGRLAVLHEFLGSSFPLHPSGGDPLTTAERAKLRRQAEAKVGPKPPKDEEADVAAWNNEVRIAYSEILQAELERRGHVVRKGRQVQGGSDVVGMGDIGTQLKDLSWWWRPPPDPMTDSHRAYRESSKEIYADMISVLFNAPEAFKARAPEAWTMFFNYLDKKPQVKADTFALWDLIHQGANAVSATRVTNLRTGFAQAEEIWLKKAAERAAKRNSLPAIIDNFKQKHFNLYAPIIDRARQVKAAGKALAWADDPEFIFDAHPLSENENYRFLDRINKGISQPLATLGLDESQLGDFLYFNRVAHEAYTVNAEAGGRTVLANPGGHTASTARRELLVMRYRLGPARYEALQGLARHLQDLAFEVVSRGHEAGIYSTANLRLAAENRYRYATFAVVDYLEASPYIPAGIKAQRGTLKDVANPFLATVMKMMTANKLIEYNRAKRVAVQLLTEHFPAEIDQAQVTRIGLAQGGVMLRAKPAPQGRKELIVLEDGRPRTWHVEPEIARMFEQRMPAHAHAIVGVMNWTFRNLFYPAFITYNPAFQLYANPVRDLRRSYVNLPPGVERRHFVGEQVRANVTARARMMADISGAELARRRLLRQMRADQSGRLPAPLAAELEHLDRRALAIELLATRAISTPFESFSVNPARTDVWGAMLQDYRLAPEEKKANFLRSHAGKLGGLLDKLEAAGLVLEAMPKAGAYRILTRELGWSAPMAAEYVRNHIGTPNYMRRGQWATMDGTVLPFINIMMQGLGADWRQARGKLLGPTDPRKAKFEWWRRMAESTLGPRLLQALAAAGLLGAGLKELYDGVSDYNKANYLVIPLGSVKDGEFGRKTIAVRLPEDETARLLGGLIHYLVQAAGNGDPLAKASLGDLVNYMGGQTPSVNPLITLGKGWLDYMSGHNPRDNFRGNTVMTPTEFNAGGWPRLQGMLAWTWNSTGGGNFIRWDPHASTTAETTISAVPGLNRMLLVTDGGYRERQMQAQANFDERNAKIRAAMPANVNALLAEYAGLSTVRKELHTPTQADRYQELQFWHTKVWEPNFKQMQEEPAKTWRRTGEGVGQVSAGFERKR